jgi:transcriptional regulator GlxA family with amidase domain
MRIQALIYDGFDELDAFGAFEPLVMAGLDVQLVSLRQQTLVSAINGVQVVPMAILSRSNLPNVLIVPGGGWIAKAETGAWAECQNGFVLEEIKAFHTSGVTLAAVCTGVLLLGKAGLLNSRPATTNHAVIDELRACGAEYIDARVVDDDDIVTAGGITSSLDLSLWLIERFRGRAESDRIAELLEYRRDGNRVVERSNWTNQTEEKRHT